MALEIIQGCFTLIHISIKRNELRLVMWYGTEILCLLASVIVSALPKFASL